MLTKSDFLQFNDPNQPAQSAANDYSPLRRVNIDGKDVIVNTFFTVNRNGTLIGADGTRISFLYVVWASFRSFRMLLREFCSGDL